MFPAAWLFGRVTARRDASGDRLRVFVARG